MAVQWRLQPSRCPFCTIHINIICMSDGNYNRTHLPYHNYQSSVRAGRAAMRQTALAAFREFVETHFADVDEALRQEHVAAFKEKLL